METDPNSYVQALTALYLGLPETPRRLSRFDYRLARELFDRQIPFQIVETALLLASARRAFRPPGAWALGPIRSLHYFLPVLEEILQLPKPLPDSYLSYLRRKVLLQPPPPT